MSAFVCSPKHIAVLAQRLLQTFNGETPVWSTEVVTVSEFAESLAVLNLKSVGSRYDYTQAQAAKEFLGLSKKEFVRQCKALADDQAVWQEEFSQAQLWGLASCFLYQSCEHDGAETDLTYRSVVEYEKVLEAYCKRAHVEREGWGL